MSFSQEKDQFVFRYRHIVVSCSHQFQTDILRTCCGDKEHVFRQVYITAFCVWLINRGQHQAFAKKQLIFHLNSLCILRVVKGKRTEEHLVMQSGLHVLTVQVRKQAIPKFQDLLCAIHIGEAVQFLFPGSHGGVIPHQRSKDPELQPAKDQVFRGVAAKAAQICAGIEESAHV